MPTNPSPTWYDILGVAPDASPEEIKTAWRAATDKFEPGSGTSQFRLFNEGADVLLDPERRAAYDAELAGAETPAAEPQAAEPDATAPEVAPVEVPAEPEDDAAADDGMAADDMAAADAATSPADEPLPDTPDTRTGALSAVGRFSVVGLAGGLGILLALAALSVILVTGINTPLFDIRGLHSTVATSDARDEASSMAERALTSVLSYDYRHMEADRDRAARFLTPAYRKQYLKNFNDLLTKGPDGTPGPAVKTQAVVKADVLDTGVVDADKDRVRVIVFVNQSSTKGTAQPTIFQDRVVATMVRRGDSWLVDNIKSY